MRNVPSENAGLGDGPRRTFGSAEILAWTLAGAAVVSAGYLRGGARLSNDSFQYLDTAENIAKGRGISSSLIYFDEQRFTGRMPAPQTVFPFGYPVAIAALATLGASPDSAGILVSACSSVVLVPVFLWAGILLNVRADYLRCVALAMILNNAFSTYSRSVLSESLFTLMSLLSLAMFLKAAAQAVWRERAVFTLLGGLTLGMSCWVRYAGLFVVAGAIVFHGTRWLWSRDRKGLLLLLLTGTSVLFALTNIVRNLALSGNIRGGNTKSVVRPLGDVIRDISMSACHVSLGDGSPRAAPAILSLSLLLAAAALAIVTILQNANRPPCPSGALTPASVLVGFYAGFYVLGLVYAGKTSFITLSDPRMLYPALPWAFLLIGVAASRAEESAAPVARKLLRASALVALACYCVLQARGVAQSGRTPGSLAIIRAAVNEPIGGDRSLTAWLDAHVMPGQPAIAGDGQAFGYFTRRPTVSLVPAAYSSTVWSEGSVRELVERYGAGVLVLFKEGPETREVAAESPFISRTLSGGSSPDWIVPAAENRDVKIFRLPSRRRSGGAAAEPEGSPTRP